MTSRPGKPPHVPDILWNLGDIFLPRSIQVRLDEFILFDPLNLWTFLHMLSGFLVAWLFPGVSFATGQWIHLGWELFQVSIGMSKLPKDLPDILLDSAAYTVGFLLA